MVDSASERWAFLIAGRSMCRYWMCKYEDELNVGRWNVQIVDVEVLDVQKFSDSSQIGLL